jgi:hypothetical protein
MEDLKRILRPGRKSPTTHVLNEIKGWFEKNEESSAIRLVLEFTISFVKEESLPRDAYRVFCGVSEILCSRTKYLKVSKWEKSIGLLLRYCSLKEGENALGDRERHAIRKVRQNYLPTVF